jgi:hypothetical protein
MTHLHGGPLYASDSYFLKKTFGPIKENMNKKHNLFVVIFNDLKSPKFVSGELLGRTMCMDTYGSKCV